MPFHKEHEQRVNLIKRIQDAEEIPWMAMGCESKNVANRRRKKSCELLL